MHFDSEVRFDAPILCAAREIQIYGNAQKFPRVT
jgi:hypothetical protein